MDFNDRRPPRQINPTPRNRRDVNSHLINDHEYIQEGAGNSARNLPTAEDLHAQHEWLHDHGYFKPDHDHTVVQPKPRTFNGLADHLSDVHGHPHPRVMNFSEMRRAHDETHNGGSADHEH